MSDINILVLSAGRRVELIERFKRARKNLGIMGKVVAVDITDTAPAIYFADSFHLVPRISHEDYIDAIVDVCIKESIDLIVPTIDTELIKLAENRSYIESRTNAKLLLSDDRVINVCRNKNNTQAFFEENGFGVPRLITKNDIKNGSFSFPLFIKPQDGSSSINTFKVNNREELDFFVKYIKDPIIQEFMEGTEFSVDVFCDFDGNPITIVPRIRLVMRSGEISKGQIVKDRAVIEDVHRLIGVLKPIGHVTVQCMKTKNGIEYIEINPRFGGGAPMSIDAGADSCENLYRLMLGQKLEYTEEYMDKVYFARFDSSIMLSQDKEPM